MDSDAPKLPDAPAPEKEAGKTKPDASWTDYVILQRDDSGIWTQDGGIVKARSAEAAIRSLESAGTFVAIPARSWKPVTVKAEVVTTLKLEEAT